MESGKRKRKLSAVLEGGDTPLNVIPPVGECLAVAASDAAFAGFNQRWMRTLVRRALDELRNEVRENHASANQWESREQAIAE
ncbi:MAG TPA: hypothetical protein VMF50_04365, partial [Candidatus Binataceae bacterium]|nr:hypothetical protein [Candidatus Binataceae bacterium]